MPRHFPFLVLTLAVAAFLRLFRLDEFPPGLHYDLATNLLIGGEIAFGGSRPIFVTAFTGREVMFFYVLAGLIRLLGLRVFTLHLAGSFLGLLSVAAAHFAVRHVMGHDRNRGWLAALSAALLAGSLWHVLLSRLGYRLLTEPLIQALALGFLFWGLREATVDRRPPTADRGLSSFGGPWSAVGGHAIALMALGGAFTGLAAYTYLAARAFPIPLAAAFLVLFVARPRQALLPFAVFTASALAVFAPLGYYFATHPETFLTRMSQVAPGQGDAGLLAQSAVAAFKMLFISGDPYLRFNNLHQPIFGPILGAFFFIGVAITLYRAVRARSPLDRAAEVMLLVWIPAMLLPTILAVHEIFPSNVRAIGLIPLVFVPAARGLIETSAWLAGRLDLHRSTPISPTGRSTPRPNSASSPSSPVSLGSLVSLVSVISFLSLVSLASSTASIYFGSWAPSAAVYRANDGDLAAAARWLNQQDLQGASAYISAIHYRHPTLAVLARDYTSLRWFTGAQALAVPPSGPAVYVFPHSSPPPAEWLAGWEGGLSAAPLGPDGEADFTAYRFDDTADIMPRSLAAALVAPEGRSYVPAPANFGNLIELLGYRGVHGVSGAEVIADLFWRVLNPPATGDFRAVADLVDKWNYRWEQGFNDAYPSEQWRTGEIVITRMRIPATAGLPPGDYHLAVTLFAPSTGERLTTIDTAGRFTGAETRVGPIAVSRNGSPTTSGMPAPAVESGWSVGPLTLLGYDPAPAALRPGESVRFALYWLAAARPEADTTVTVRLTPVGGLALTLESGAPVHGSYPTSRWSGGEIVIDRHAPRLPRDLEPGGYDLALEAGGQSLSLGSLDVRAIPREFTPPAPSIPAALNFGDTVQLVGYDLQAQTLVQTLILYWQSLAETETDYTVFVHWLDEGGQIVDQRDVQPRDGAYPTSLWLAGEYIADTHSFHLPPGAYTLEVGMYVPENGVLLGQGNLGTIVVP